MNTAAVVEVGVSFVVAALLAFAVWRKVFRAYVTRESAPSKGWTTVQTRDLDNFLNTIATLSTVCWWITYMAVQGYLRGGAQDTWLLFVCVAFGAVSLATPTIGAALEFRYLVYQVWREG
jgi:hypothetical protein